MTTTIERITAIIDEATADERAKVLDLERRLSNAYADLVSKKEALTNVTRDLRDLTVENNQQRAEVTHLGKLNAEQDEQIRALRDMLARATPATDDATLIVALRHQCDDLKETIAALTSDRGSLLAEVAKRDATIAALEVKNRALGEELVQSRRALAQEFRENQRMQRANEPAGYVEPSQEVVDLLTKIDSLENKLDSVTRATSKQIERLTREKATAYRKLAEVSRKCLGLMKESAHLRTLNAKIVDDCNKEIDELTEKCAALVVENRRLDEYASGNWVDVPPPSDAGCLYPECGPTCRRDCPPAPAVETPAVEVKGPWVVYDPEREYGLPYRSAEASWVKPEDLDDVVLFRDASSAQAFIEQVRIERYRVITLAEARAIEAQKTNG